MKIKHLLPVALVASAFLAGCGTLAGSSDRKDGAPHRTVGEAVDDAKIVTELKAKYAADPDLSAIKINIDSTQGFVRLKGEDAQALSDSPANLTRARPKPPPP